MRKFYSLITAMLMCLVSAQAARQSSPTGVQLDKHELNTLAGTTHQLKATILPEDGGFDANLLDWSCESISGGWISVGPNYNDPSIGEVSVSDPGSARIIVKIKETDLADTCIVTGQYRASGQCGDELYWSLDGGWRLIFWAHSVGGSKPASEVCDMWDFSASNPAPWHAYADSIADVWMSNVNTIGNNALRDIKNIFILQISAGHQLRDSVLWGCEKLKVIMMDDTCVTPVTATSLKTGENSEIRGVFVRYEDQHPGLIESFKADPIWGAAGRVITPGDGEWNKLYWYLSQSDSLYSLRLRVEPGWGENPGYSIPDIDTTIVVDRAPWHEWRDLVTDLEIALPIRRIGNHAFSSLTGLQVVRFVNHQEENITDTIHYGAFDHSIRPWKFAFADGSAAFGPAIPPVVVGMGSETPSNYDEAGTVLYVCDKKVAITQPLQDRFGIPSGLITDDSIKAVHLYALAPYWSSFNRITDYTVTVSGITSSSANLKWLPIEEAVSYRLWIGKDGCATCDTTIDIPALGGKGLLDWENMTIPTYLAPAPRRAIKEDDGGGMLVLVISIKTGSAQAANEDVSVEAAGLAPNTTYHFSRTVFSQFGEMQGMAKTGSFTTLAQDATDLQNVRPTSNSTGCPGVYDMMGRRVADHASGLPAGVYIIDNGQTRTTCILMP